MNPQREMGVWLTTCTGITKNGIIKLAAPPPVDTSKITSEKKIEDEEILKLLELPLKSDPKKKKKKAAAKAE
jgi:hypothetical protein